MHSEIKSFYQHGWINKTQRERLLRKEMWNPSSVRETLNMIKIKNESFMVFWGWFFLIGALSYSFFIYLGKVQYNEMILSIPIHVSNYGIIGSIGCLGMLSIFFG